MLYKKIYLKHGTKFTENHLCMNLKEIPTQMFSYEFYGTSVELLLQYVYSTM